MRLRELALMFASLVACTDRATGSATEVETTGTSSSTATTSGVETTAVPTTGATTAAETGVEPICEPYTFAPVIVTFTPSVMLAIDHSPAMLDGWDHDGDPQTPERSRWASVRATLDAVLSPIDPQRMALGLARFPGATASGAYEAEACAVDPGEFLAPATDNIAPILAALPAEDAPLVGAAPLREALVGSLALLAGAPVDMPRVIVILTHSAPNCGQPADELSMLLEGLDEGVGPLLAQAEAEGVRVIVLGIGTAAGPSPPAVDMRPDGVDLVEYWQSAAVQSFVAIANEAALLDELGLLLAPAEGSPCWFTIDPPPRPEHQVANVRVGGTLVSQVDDCEAEDGWLMTADSELVLCGAACARWRETSVLEVELVCGP
ncbi:hypothetical protein [Nannocystis radixulma]|uniref:VWFA domain-containing protein n=1 Tax=Nannocystis radixulma TaxID=2995305 RepID=A0ABT5BMJ8_9BACT|nr:hypothetical protein [Nannocystis radixulma]MDC0675392.1 hypothetical protein [Nannocystis radixulma]